MTSDAMRRIVGNILRDIRIELSDEFDKNFTRQGFFAEAWERRRSPLRPGGAILVDTGNLRRSIGSKSDSDSITFFSDAEYAAVHNEGGEIKVTARMKRFFWAKFYEASGSFGRKKNGEKRGDRRTRQLTAEAEFWQHMALMKVGATIRIPRRQFLGYSPEVEKYVTEIIEENLEEFFGRDDSVIPNNIQS